MPLVFVAMAATLGIVADRFLGLPLPFAIAAGLASLLAWLLTPSRRAGLAICYLLLAALAFGASWHHRHQHVVSAEDVRRLASAEGTPITLVARLLAPPTIVPANNDPLQSIPRTEAVKLLLDVSSRVRPEANQPACGRIVAYIPGSLHDVFPGDELELQGRLFLPRGPGNPGEYDPAQDLADQGIGAILSVPPSADAVRLVASRWPSSLTGWLGRLHHACKSLLREHLTIEPDLAAALLLGDGSGLTRPAWDKFLKSGVIHALAISGQHLVVLAGFLALIRRACFVRLAPGTIAIALILVGYALLTGGRAPAMRAAWIMLVLALGVCLKRPPSPANALALAWLGVILFNPADIFQVGCQLSFLAVGLLQWVITPWLTQQPIDKPLDDLPLAEPTQLRLLLTILRNTTAKAYLANAVIWCVVTPLIADRFHLVSPIALLIGPPVVVATSLALLSGFLLLIIAPVLGSLAAPLAWVTDLSLLVCESIIDLGLKIPGASFNIADLPNLWMIAFYLFLAAALIVPTLRRHPRLMSALTVAWLLAGLLWGWGYLRPREFRVAFLSVGHGGCAVIETGSGKVLVYDAGTMSGPDLTRRIIAPYLATRGITRIDDLFISHADLDHFSGVPDLLDRVAVARVTLTPSFADRSTPGVRRVLSELKARQIPTRFIKAGDHETVDDVHLNVFHPPLIGPEGKENVRSLVMLVRQKSFALLLTGDLEEAGLDQLMALRPPAIDVLMAPHHGSRLANPPALANWAKPRVVISSQGRPRSQQTPAPIYEALAAHYLTTWHDGAIILTNPPAGTTLTTHQTKKTLTLPPPPVR